MRILPLVMITTMATNCPADELSIHSVKECQAIRVLVGNAWILTFNPNGSGYIQYGALPSDGGEFPEETVDFQRLFKSLTPTLLVRNRDRSPLETISVGLEWKGKKSTAGYTLKPGSIEKAFGKAISRIDPYTANRLEFLILWSPPFSGSGQRYLNQITNRATHIARLEKLIEVGSKGHEQIGIYTRNGWKLIINKDGSGELSIGRHPSLSAKIGKNSFDFSRNYQARIQERLERTHQEMLKKPRTKSPVPDIQARNIMIGAKPAEKTVTLMFAFADDPSAIKDLFDQAWHSATLPEKDTEFAYGIRTAWKKRPPVTLSGASK